VAQIKVYRDELDDLPDVCARSGKPTDRRVRKTFSWHPPWVGVLLLAGVLPYLIVSVVLAKRMTVSVPLRGLHAYHWLIRNVLIFGGLLLLAAMGVTAVVLLDRGRGSEVGGALFLLTFFGGVAWLILTLVLYSSGIRPTEITDDSITLTGVSRAFADAVQRRIEGLPDEEIPQVQPVEKPRPRRHRPRRLRVRHGRQITVYTDERDDLPSVCARCGTPAQHRVRRTFAWYPSWVILLLFAGVLPYLIVSSVLRKQRTVPVPLCDRHAKHWRWRTILTYGALLGLCLVGVSSMVFADREWGPTANMVAGLVCIGAVCALFPWLIMVLILQATSIRAVEITDDSITLTGLSQEFADVVHQQQEEMEGEPEEDFGVREQQRRKPEPPSADFRA
jgi:hypothetical protein